MTNLAAGTYAISAVATDNLGAKATNSITLIVNARPTVTLSSPTNGAIFAAPATVAIQASATDTDGTISQVQFFTNSASLLIDTAAPYEATAANLPAGTYDLPAVATDNRNALATSSLATISVVNPVEVVLSGCSARRARISSSDTRPIPACATSSSARPSSPTGQASPPTRPAAHPSRSRMPSTSIATSIA